MLVLQNLQRSHSYLHNLIPKNVPYSYSLRATKEIPLFRVKHGFFKSYVFPSAIIEWNNLDHYLHNAPSLSAFKQNILKLILFGPNRVYNVYNPSGIKFRFALSHLRTQKFSQNFSDCFDELCICGTNIESMNHSFLHCLLYLSERKIPYEENP